MNRPCQVRGCRGVYVAYQVTTQVGTGHKLTQFECTKNLRHRGWEIDALGVFHKQTAGRWAVSQLDPTSAGGTR